MIKTGYFLIKKITPKKILSILIFSQLHYVGTHVAMIVWAFDGHWMQKTLDFKLMLHICDLFTYPTLTKSPAEIALPGCDNDNKWKVIFYVLRTHWNDQTKVPRGVQPTPLNKALFGVGPLTTTD